MSPKDPFATREAEKYEKPIASRELILALIEKNGRPMSRDEIEKTLMSLPAAKHTPYRIS